MYTLTYVYTYMCACMHIHTYIHICIVENSTTQIICFVRNGGGAAHAVAIDC